MENNNKTLQNMNQLLEARQEEMLQLKTAWQTWVVFFLFNSDFAVVFL
jgi:hypothetical protein